MVELSMFDCMFIWPFIDALSDSVTPMDENCKDRTAITPTTYTESISGTDRVTTRFYAGYILLKIRFVNTFLLSGTINFGESKSKFRVTVSTGSTACRFRSGE